jgi:hypothetical protein
MRCAGTILAQILGHIGDAFENVWLAAAVMISEESKMEKSTAKTIIDTISGFDPQMKILSDAIKKQKNIEEQKEMMNCLGETFFYLNSIKRIAIKHYPELDPD